MPQINNSQLIELLSTYFIRRGEIHEEEKEVFSGCKVTRTTAQAITSGSPQEVAWQTTIYDTDGYWSVGDATKIFIPSDGLYYVAYAFLLAANATGTRAFAVVLNGDSSDDIIRDRHSAPNAGKAGWGGSTVRALEEGDYLEGAVYHNAGGSLNLDVDGPSPMMLVHRIGDIP